MGTTMSSAAKEATIRKTVIAICTAALVGSAAPVLAGDANELNATLDAMFGEHQRYQTFFTDLKKAVIKGYKNDVAALVDYPFMARIDGKRVEILDAAHFVADYDKIITASVANALHAQAYEDLFVNWQGVMVGDGEIWFAEAGDTGQIKITAIND